MWWIQHKAKRTFERSLPVTGHVRLEVRTESGDVAVKGGREGVVRVCGRIYVWGPAGQIRKVLDEIERHPPVAQTGSTIRIGDIASGLEDSDCSVELDYWIETPSDTEVRVETESGDVKITGLRGPVVVKTDSGDVEMSRIEGDVDVQTDSGDVEGDRLGGTTRFDVDSGDIALRDVAGPVRVVVDSGDVAGERLGGTARFDADSGDIALRDVAGPVWVATDSGDVEVADLGAELDLETDSGDVTLASAVPERARWTVHTDSGAVEVRLPRASRCLIEAETSCGDIESDLPLTIESEDDESSARGVLGEGATARIEVSTDSGDIAFRWRER